MATDSTKMTHRSTVASHNATSVATAGLMLPTVRRARSSKLAAPAMNLLDQIGRAMSGGGGSDLDLPPLDDRAPAWEELRAQLDAASTEHERSFRQRVADGSGPEAMALASKRTFDDPAAQPRVLVRRSPPAGSPAGGAHAHAAVRPMAPLPPAYAAPPPRGPPGGGGGGGGTMADKLKSIRQELVIDAALPMAAAIKQANDTMGLPSQGPLPQQVAALVAALGIRV